MCVILTQCQLQRVYCGINLQVAHSRGYINRDVRLTHAGRQRDWGDISD